MGDNITGELNNTEPVCVQGIDNQGGAVEADDNTEDDRCAGTGNIDVARFPSQTLDLDGQAEAAAKRAATSPNGGDATAQFYRAEVPFSDSKLELGAASSKGGVGASITTKGNVFVGATGKLGLQSVGAFTGQTRATMGLYAAAGVTAHSQDKFEIYAGGGVAPGDCGSGRPAGSARTTKPAEAAEKWTTVGCNALGVVKAANDLYNAGLSLSSDVKAFKDLASDAKTAARVVAGLKVAADAVSGAKAVNDMAGKGYSAGAGATAETKDEKDALKKNSKSADKLSAGINAGGGAVSLASAVASALAGKPEDAVSSLLAGKPDDAVSSLLSGVSSLVSAGSSLSGAADGTSGLNREGPVPRSTGAASAVPGAEPAGPGGPLDIEKRAAAKIHQVCNVKISGNAPEGIDWKVGGAYLVNAISGVDFATTNWGAFAAAMFKVRAVAVIDVKCRRFEMKALAKGTVKTLHTTITASSLSTLDGITHVTETLSVLKHSTLHDGLHAANKEKNTLVTGNLTVQKDATTKNDAKFHEVCKFTGDVTVKGQVVSKRKLKAASEGKFG